MLFAQFPVYHSPYPVMSSNQLTVFSSKCLVGCNWFCGINFLPFYVLDVFSMCVSVVKALKISDCLP